MKHTIFGEVSEGSSVVEAIEKVEKDPMDKPIEDIKIVAISVEE
jgi:cyclophilin family peptidyl-prolyl cis-trans isomerase